MTITTTNISFEKCPKTGLDIIPDRICEKFWMKSTRPTTNLPNGCWCCVWSD